LLIYGILFVSECLGKVKQGVGRKEAEKVRVWKAGEGKGMVADA